MSVIKRYICVLFFCSLIGVTLYSAEEKIQVFFNKNVDFSVASGDSANSDISLDSLLCSYIHRADYSIDCCIYSFNDWSVRDSLIAAYKRGVSIRFITDNENITAEIESLISDSIPVINDTFSVIYDGNYSMHNKFLVFDFRDSTSLEDDYVWTGSYNVTYQGGMYNAQNAILINDHDLARAYTYEFEEMWGSRNDTPNSVNSRFSTYKTDNTQHLFDIDGIPLELYFSPSDSVEEHIIDKINNTDYEIYFSLFFFTNQNICDAMYTVWNGSGTDDSSNVRGVFDSLCWIDYGPSKARDMAGLSGNPWYPPLDTSSVIVKDNVDNYGLLHHKYMLIDAYHMNSEQWTISGSVNFTYFGINKNDENCIMIRSNDITNLFFQEWMARYKEAGGTFSGIELEVKEKNYNLELSSEFILNNVQITLYTDGLSETPIIEIFNVKGSIVSRIPLNYAGNNTYKANWDTKKQDRKLPSGIYFLSLHNVRNFYKKFILLN